MMARGMVDFIRESGCFFVFSVALCLAPVYVCSGKENNEPGLKLERVLAEAAQHNPAIQRARAQWEAARERIPQAASLPDPRLAYGYFVESVETRTGPQDQRVGLSQTFPWLGTLSLKEKIADQHARATYEQVITTEINVYRDVQEAFYEYAYLHAAIRLNAEHLGLLKLVESVATSRYKAGRLSQSSLIQLQVEQGKQEDHLRHLQAMRSSLSSVLRAATGTPATNLYPWPEPVASTFPEISPDDVRARFYAGNPELKKLNLMVGASEAGVELARKAFFPDVTLGVDMIDTDGGDDPVVASISVNLPIWRDRLRASEREALLRKEGATAELEDRSNQLAARLDILLFKYQDALRKQSLYSETLIPKAQQASEIALRDFEAGKTGFSELIDAQRTLLEFQLLRERQGVDVWITWAYLQALIGVEK